MYGQILLKPENLHIPDGFLTLPVAISFWVVTIITIVIAVRKTRNNFEEKQIPLMGIMAAFIFAAQMINFPVAGGTSGHLLGGVLAAITLGPWAGILVMTSVIGIQALLFQDGGLLVMGANIFNMGLLTVLIGFGFYRAVLGKQKSFVLFIVGIAAWLSVLAGALATGLQLWLSGTSALHIVIPAMLGVHSLIGIGEAFITIAAIGFILQTRPDLLNLDATKSRGGKGWIIIGAIVAIIVVLLSPIASASPDGLERVAEDLGFISHETGTTFSILPDYSLPVLGNTSISTIFAGIIGICIVSLVVTIIARTIRKSSKMT